MPAVGRAFRLRAELRRTAGALAEAVRPGVSGGAKAPPYIESTIGYPWPMVPLTLVLAILAAPAVQAQTDLNTLFNQGQEWTTWLADVNTQRTTWDTVVKQANPPEAMVERLKAAGAGLKLLLVAEAACSDSMQSVPHIAALAARAGIDLRIVGKDAATAALEGHRTPDGRTATPTLILVRDGKAAGAWVERPEALQTWIIAQKGISRQELLARKTSWYQWDRGTSTLAEIVAQAERR